MTRLEMKNYNMILIKEQIIEQAKFAYSFLGKALKKQTEYRVGALKSLELFNKKGLKQIEGMIP